MHVHVHVQPVADAYGVGGGPAAQPAGVIAGPVVVEAAFLVLFFSCISVPLLVDFARAASGAVAGVAVGVVFLVANYIRGVVQLQ